jgi:hypothetical protein
VVYCTHRLEAEDTAFDGDRYLGDYVEAEVLMQTVIRETIIDVAIIDVKLCTLVQTGFNSLIESHRASAVCVCIRMTV